MTLSTLSPVDPSTRHTIDPLLPVVGATTRVPLANGGDTTYANLDNAASAPALASVVARVAQVLPHYASVHRGAGYLSRLSTALFEQARAQVGEQHPPAHERQHRRRRHEDERSDDDPPAHSAELARHRAPVAPQGDGDGDEDEGEGGVDGVLLSPAMIAWRSEVGDGGRS